MSTVSFNISTEAMVRVKEAFLSFDPVPMSGVLDENGNVVSEVPMYTDNVWVKMCLKNDIKKKVARYEQKKAKDAIIYTEDDSLVSVS